MSNTGSKLFNDTARNITDALADIFNGTEGYKTSVVIKLERASTRTVRGIFEKRYRLVLGDGPVRADAKSGNIQATVNNIFQNTNLDNKQVEEIFINKSLQQANTSYLADVKFTSKDVCELDPYPCNRETANCTSANGNSQCPCLDGYIIDQFSSVSCKACESGFRADGDGCVPCMFLLKGFNCNDGSLLAVVVVSVVLGTALLAFVITSVLFVSRRSKTKSQKTKSSNPYLPQQPWKSGVSRLPRATTKWDESPPTESSQGVRSRPKLTMTNEDNRLSGSYNVKPAMKTFKEGKQQKSTDLVQGQENPSFLPEDRKT
ncbi:hypothetical protein fugu_015174 [Takifugu bimaculatus]|uniref:SEA domain-containing protein n=1 Tax=Takifugu bimaculatus TaxID=433685 RepID=A0A4Z2BZ32_9TELE|nr:hypothetical protein fugu_015174 [Takifugu bimaculatus]